MSLVSIWALPVLLAITLHEVAHGWVARLLGDDTAARLGRLSLNPLKHIDPIGTVVVPTAMLFLGGFIFGWAKPVPVNIRQLNQPKRDMAIVAAAGPISNLLMALCWALIAKIGQSTGDPGNWIALTGQAGIIINLLLCLLNLIPLPPLDGGRVLAGLAPMRVSYLLAKIEPFGLFILVGLLVFGILGQIISPPYLAMTAIINSLFGLT